VLQDNRELHARIAHLVQLVFAVRYVNKIGDPVEWFLTFIVMKGRYAEHLTNNVINILKGFNFSLQLSRSKLRQRQHNGG